jgi:putative DNA primase/helicase
LIFANNAPALWKRGLPVIPLYEREKKPIPTGWSAYKDTMPALEMQTFWIGMHPNSNIGLPLGPQAGLIAIDLDTDDPRALAVLETILPASPWKRVGAKGAVWLYRFGGQRTARIKTMDGKVLCEILSAGTQVVLPPSIHPTTQRPYEANCELLDVLGDIPSLPEDIEIVLRKAFIAAGFELTTHGNTKISEWTPAGARDSQMVSHAGILARAITRGERSLQSALSEITHWVETYTEKVAGDDLDPEKARLKVIEFLVRDVESGRILPRGWDDDLSDEEKTQMHALFGGSKADVVEWSFDELKSYVTEGFKKHQASSNGRVEVVEFVLKKVASAKTLSVVHEDQVLKYINQCDKAFSMASNRKLLRELKKGEIEGNDHTEIADAVLAELARSGEVRHFAGKFWQWGGASWIELPKSAILTVVMREFGKLPAARKHNDHKQIIAATAAIAEKPLQTEAVNGINFANGYLTSDMQLLPHDAKYGCTYVLPYRYLKDLEGSACHRFQTFLMDGWGHNDDFADRVQCLREAIAVTLFGMGPKFQRVISLYGIAGSGKSALKDMIMGLMPPEAVCSVPPQDWAERWSPSRMFGKLVNFCGELSDSKPISGELFKSIVVGEKIKGEFKGKDEFEFEPTCTHWFATNTLPKTKDTSDGFVRRWVFLHFDKAVPEEQRIIGLAEDILAEEREAIVAWAAPAIQDLLKRGRYTLPASHTEQERHMANSNNTVRAFLESDMLKFKADAHLSASALYTHYMSYCSFNGTRPYPSNIFKILMRDLVRRYNYNINTNADGSLVYEGIAVARPS